MSRKLQNVHGVEMRNGTCSVRHLHYYGIAASLLILLSLFAPVLASLPPSPSDPSVPATSTSTSPCASLSFSSCLSSSPDLACAWCEILTSNLQPEATSDTHATLSNGLNATSSCMPFDPCQLHLFDGFDCSRGILLPAEENVCELAPTRDSIDFSLRQTFVCVSAFAIIVLALPWLILGIYRLLLCCPSEGVFRMFAAPSYSSQAASVTAFTWCIFGLQLQLNTYIYNYHWCAQTILLFAIGLNTASKANLSNEFLLVIFATGFILMEFRLLGLQLIGKLKRIAKMMDEGRTKQQLIESQASFWSAGLVSASHLVIIALVLLIPSVVSWMLIMSFDDSSFFRPLWSDGEERQIKVVAVLDVLVSWASSVAREALAYTQHEFDDEHHGGSGSGVEHNNSSSHSTQSSSSGSPARVSEPPSDGKIQELTQVQVHLPPPASEASSDVEQQPSLEEEKTAASSPAASSPPSHGMKPFLSHLTADEIPELSSSGQNLSEEFLHVENEGFRWSLPSSFKHPLRTIAHVLFPPKSRFGQLCRKSLQGCRSSISGGWIRNAWRRSYLSRTIDIVFLLLLCVVAHWCVAAKHQEIRIHSDNIGTFQSYLVISPQQSMMSSPLLPQYWAEQEYDNWANVIATVSLMRTVYVTVFLHHTPGQESK